MSGGEWNYQEFKIKEEAERTRKFLLAVAESEHIVDWVVSGDTLPEYAGRELLELWERTFRDVYEGEN